MEKIKFGGLRCAGCGNNSLRLSVSYSGADWRCAAGEGSGYGCEVALACDQCGRIFPICHVRREDDVSAIAPQE